jgi:PHP family Zn ribbon phosphoesterase
MKAFYDLHIHSVLSPCADNDMTPNNIVNMAFVKGLDIIAVTDHNSVENCEAVLNCAKKRGIVAVPGMELETGEEVHVLCLFPGLDKALEMQELVYKALPPLENREEIFGQQIIMDEGDNVVRHLKQLLLTASRISLEEAFSSVCSLGGVLIPAHIDRDSYSIISNLGSIPEELGIKHLEISKTCEFEKYIKMNSQLREFKFVSSSDAHTIGDILERVNSIEIEELSIECLISTLRY